MHAASDESSDWASIILKENDSLRTEKVTCASVTMKDLPVFPVVWRVLLVLLFAEAGYGETQSQEQVLGL